MNFPHKFDKFLSDIQSIIMSFLVRLGPFGVALMPALFTGYAIWFTFQIEAGQFLALSFALVVGLAIETVGIVATHTSVDLYNAMRSGVIEPVKFRLMVWLVPVYVIGVSSVVYFSGDAFTPLIKGLGIASPFLTCIVYVAVALASDVKNIKAEMGTKAAEIGEIKRLEAEATLETVVSQSAENAVEKAENRDWEKELTLKKLDQEHELAMAEIGSRTGPRVVHEPVHEPKKMGREAQKKADLDQIMAAFAENPGIKTMELVRAVRPSKGTVIRYTKELVDQKKLIENGQGWEVRTE